MNNAVQSDYYQVVQHLFLFSYVALFYDNACCNSVILFPEGVLVCSDSHFGAGRSVPEDAHARAAMAGRHGDAGGRLCEDDNQVPSLCVLSLNIMWLSYATGSNCC